MSRQILTDEFVDENAIKHKPRSKRKKLDIESNRDFRLQMKWRKRQIQELRYRELSGGY